MEWLLRVTGVLHEADNAYSAGPISHISNHW